MGDNFWNILNEEHEIVSEAPDLTNSPVIERAIADTFELESVQNGIRVGVGILSRALGQIPGYGPALQYILVGGTPPPTAPAEVQTAHAKLSGQLVACGADQSCVFQALLQAAAKKAGLGGLLKTR